MKRRPIHVLSLRTRPPLVVLLLVAANVLAFAFCAYKGGSAAIPGRVMVAYGALTSWTAEAGQYWRLGAYGFLHFDPVHLLFNLWWVVAAGPALERRLGATAFASVYAAAMVGGGVASLWGLPGHFVTAGASGAAFGLFGAEFALWILGKARAPASYFLTNFAMSIAWTMAFPRVNWIAHLGGFAAGMLAIRLLDLLAQGAGRLLRCRFPEFVKANALLLAGAGAVHLWQHPVPLPGADPRVVGAAAWVAGAVAFVKLLDLLLASRRGLAGVVLLLGMCNGILAYGGALLLRPALDAACGIRSDGALDGVARLLCQASGQAPAIAGAAACAATLLLLAGSLRRGLGDVGFVAAAFIGDRRRADGL